MESTSTHDFHVRLRAYLDSREMPTAFEQLTPDASTREYFRVRRSDATAIACVYPEPFTAGEHTYLDVSELFLKCGLPVAKVLDFDESLGVILIEDLGNTILREVLIGSNSEDRERLIDQAISLIAKIQAATGKAFETRSIASRLKFDEEKLLWELDFFRDHFFATYQKQPLSAAESSALTAEFVEIARELESKAAVLCHRDFHAANLMLDQTGSLRIIDHQDARIGSVSYDLVSFLLDRVTSLPTPEWLEEKRLFFLDERESVGLATIDKDAFRAEFRLQAIQRCLKAVGTFSYQSAVRGKTYFVPFIKPMIGIVLSAAEHLDRFPALKDILRKAS